MAAREWLEALGQDARYAVRGMRRTPSVTAVAMASLALGIGANTAIFSLLDTILLRSLPVEDPGRVVELLFQAPRQDHFNLFSSRSYEHYRDENHVFSGVIAFGFEPFAVRGEGLEAERARGLWVSGNYFSVLGVKPALGRLAADDPDAVVVSWSWWKSRFNLDPGVIGKRIVINDVPATIAGVTAREFLGLELGSKWDVWVPMAMEPRLHHPSNLGTTSYWLKLAARLKPGVSIEQARAEMAVLFRWTQDDEFRKNDDRSVYQWKIEVAPAGSGLAHVRDQFAKPALVLMGVVGLLLAIACANVSSVLMARAAGRRRELAVRVALGAGRLRLVRQGLTESLVLAAGGGALGVLLAYLGTEALTGIIASGREGLELDARPDGLVLLFTAAVAISTGVLFGLAPALQAFQTGPAAELRGRRRLFGRGLVAMQVALSVVLLTGAGLFVGHLAAIERLDLGFHRDHVLLVSLDDSHSGGDRERLARAYQDLVGRLEAIPGVRSATICAFYPASGVGAMRPANVEGYQAKPGERRFLSESWVAPRYFETLGMPLVAGRDFRFEDRGRPRVAIVNRTLARYFFGEGNPIGKHITFDGDDQPYEIVGVAGDTRSTDAREPGPRMVYFNMFQYRRVFSEFALRTAVEPRAVADAVRRTVRGTLATVTVGSVRTMAEQVDAALVPERLTAMLSGLFGGLGAALAALGLYGLLAYAVTRRTSEIGVRMALGATRRDISGMVAREALAMVFGGLAIGGPVAYWGKRFATSVIPGLPPAGALPVAAGGAAMVLLGLAAASIPARRAMQVDPTEALRHE